MKGAKVTMAQVAEKAGVSKATVSRALAGSSLIGDEMRGHIERISSEMGYVKKRQKRHSERSILTVKMVMPPIANEVSQLFYGFMHLVSGLRDGLAPSGVNVIVENNGKNYRPFPHKKGGSVDAFVFAFHCPTTEVIKEIEKKGVACVVLDRMVRGVRQVVSDHSDALYQIAEHLADRGVTGDCCFVAYEGIEAIMRERLHGFERGCDDCGIAFDAKDDVWMVAQPEEIHLKEVKALYEQGVRNFVAVNDITGLILLQQLNRLGYQIPKDVRVTGCGRSPLRDITHPKLTTVDLSVYKLAFEAGRSLHQEVVERVHAENALLIQGEILPGKTT